MPRSNRLWKKRVFRGNQHTKPATVEHSQACAQACASAKQVIPTNASGASKRKLSDAFKDNKKNKGMPPKRRKRARGKYLRVAKRVAATSVTAAETILPKAPVTEIKKSPPKLNSPPKEPPVLRKMPVASKQKLAVEGGEAVFERDNHGAFLSQSLNDFRRTSTMCDVMLRLPISGKIFQAHRLILRARSPFFRTVFENQVHRNCKNLVVSLPNYVRPEGVEPILDYIYTGLLKVSTSTVAEIFQVAWLFKMEDVLAMCRQYCKTQRINPMQVNVMGDHCFLRRDVSPNGQVEKDNEIKKVVPSLPASPPVTTFNVMPSLGNLKTIFPQNLITVPQLTAVSQSPAINMALKFLATTTTAATVTTTANISKPVHTTVAQPVQVMPSTLSIPNLPKQLTSLVGNNSVVVLSAGDIMYGGREKNGPPIPKAVLEQLQALSKSTGGNKQRVFIVKTNSPRSLIKPASPETVAYKPSKNDVVTMDGPPEVIECTPTLPENDEDTDSAEESGEDKSQLYNDIDEPSEFSELKISNVTSVNDDDDVAPKFFASAEDDKEDSDNSNEAILPEASRLPCELDINNANKSDDENTQLASDSKRLKTCEAAVSSESNSSEGRSSEKSLLKTDKPKATELCDSNSSNQSDNSESMVPDSVAVGCVKKATDDEPESETEGSESSQSTLPWTSCEVEEPAVIIFRPKDASSKITLKIDDDKQHLHAVVHVLKATEQHRELLLTHGFFHAQVHINGKCHNVVVTADSDVQSLSIGSLNYVFPVEYTVEDSDLERFANMANNTGHGWTTIGSLIFKPSADRLNDGNCEVEKEGTDASTERNHDDLTVPEKQEDKESPTLINIVVGEDMVENEKLLCGICKTTFKSLHSKSSHMFKHHRDSLHKDKDGIDKFVCEVCQYKCPSLRRMYFHRFYQHHWNLPDGVTQFRCGLCPSIEYSFVMLKNHYYRYHKGIKSFACDYCNFTSKLMSTLQTHTKLMHSECPRFQCDFCGKVCRDRCSLENHRRTHTGEKPFECTHCSYASAVQGNLKMHMQKVHHVEFQPKISSKRKHSEI